MVTKKTEKKCWHLGSDASDNGSFIRHERRILQRITDGQKSVELDQKRRRDDSRRRPPVAFLLEFKATEGDARGQSYETLYDRNLRIFVIS
jgi:hypothetical protein